MSLTYYHAKSDKSFDGTDSSVHEEIIKLGPKGLFIKAYHKDKKEIYKISVSGSGGSYVLRTSKGKDSKVDEQTLSKADLIKEIKKNDKLNFALDFAEKFSSSISRAKGSKKGTRKGTKKGTKRRAKK